MTPLLTHDVYRQLLAARDAGLRTVECSLDLRRSLSEVEIAGESWTSAGRHFPYPNRCRERTIYYWSDAGEFRAAARFSAALIKLVPTEWGPPTFEIDGIKMLPTAHVSPYADAQRKVGLVRPQGKVVLDTCGGLGYFAAACVTHEAARIVSYEKNSDVIWLRSLNPWSPPAAPPLTLMQADVAEAVPGLPSHSIDAVLHDPPRFGIAGELYSRAFYAELARVLKRGGTLFHYTGAPNKVSRARDFPGEVMQRLRAAGFSVAREGDGVLAIKR